MLVDGPLFFSLRRRVDGRLHPIGVIEVQEYELYKFGPSRIRTIDPHRVWRRHDPEMYACTAKLEHRHYQSFGEAAQMLYQAFNPAATRTSPV